jgi:hypothetical protein
MALSNKLKRAIASREIDARNDVARLDMAFGLASVARPRKTGAQPKAFAETIKQTWVGGVIGIRGIALSDHDLGVLLALIILAEQQKPVVEQGVSIEGLLLPTKSENAATVADVVTVKTTHAKVAMTMGIKSKGSCVNDAIWESLKNLATIVIDVKDNNRVALTHLIKQGQGTKDTALVVTLSYRITRAIFGDGSFAAVDMRIFAALPKGAARIMYVWLASWFGGASGTRHIKIDNLAVHVWGSDATAEEVREHRRTLSLALQKLNSASESWCVKIEKQMIEITRIKS